MRRKDREMPAEFALTVADSCVYAVLSMVDPTGAPYSVPLNIVRDGNTVFFHCAAEGFKTDCLRQNPAVCLVCVDNAHRPPDAFTTKYESAILRGTAAEVETDEEKIHALHLLCLRHTPTHMDAFTPEIEKYLAHTAVWRIEIEEITGKKH